MNIEDAYLDELAQANIEAPEPSLDGMQLADASNVRLGRGGVTKAQSDAAGGIEKPLGAMLDMGAATVKGAAQGFAGLPGDLEGIARTVINALGGNVDENTAMPTTEEIKAWIDQFPMAKVGDGKNPYESVGEVVAPGGQIKAGKAAVKGAKVAGKALAPKAGEMLDAYMQRTGLKMNLMAYHGTPHKFDKFDAAKIGTGEGAQVYGHGLYFAENEGVAKGYQIATSKDRFLTKDGLFDPSELEHLNVRAVTRRGNLDQAIEEAKKYAGPDHDYPETAAKAARDLAKLEALKASGGIRPNQGTLFTVDIPDSMVANMLDWDKPLSQQPEAVQDGIKRLWSDNRIYGDPVKLTGEGIYGSLQAHYTRGMNKQVAQEAASKDLTHYGIPGIRYLDAGSRDSGKGTRNIVVFPGGESQIKIIKTEGAK